MIKNTLISIFLLLACTADAGFPPTTSQVIGDVNNVTTFNYQFPFFAGTHTGSTVSLGVLTPAGGGTGTGTAFTLGSVIFAGASGVFTQDNSSFFYDATNHRLGLGTASPGARLMITGAITGTPSLTTGAQFSVGNSTFTDSATLSGNTASAYTVNSFGSPTLAATNTSVTTTNAINFRVSGAPNAGTNESITNATSLQIASGALSGTIATSIGLSVAANSGATNNYAAIFTGGNVGVGVGSPTAILHVGGSATGANTTNGTSVRINPATYTDNATAGSGTASNQAFVSINSPTLAATNTLVTTPNASTLYINSAPTGSANDTITSSYGLNIATQALTAVTNGTALNVAAPSGATNNYAALFTGNVGIGTTTPTSALEIKSSSANAFNVGLNGATNPAFNVDASTASSATGISVKSAAAAGGALIQTVSSGTNEALNIATKGTGVMNLQVNGATKLAIAGTSFTFTPITMTGTGARFLYTAPADSTLTAGSEALDIDWNLSAIRQHGSNTAITLQRDYLVRNATHSFVTSGGVITDAAAFTVLGPPIGGTNATLTNTHAIYVPTVAVGTATNSYGLTVNAASGATNNYAAQFIGGNVGIGTSSPNSSLQVNGSYAGKVNSISGNTTLDATYQYVLVDTTSAAVNVTLPDCVAGIIGRVYEIKNIGNNAVNMVRTGSDDTFDGGTSYTWNTKYEAHTFVCATTTLWGIF